MIADEAVFVAPSSIGEAVDAMGAPDAIAVSGGTSVGLLIGQGLLAPATVVWLGRIPELRGIRHDGHQLVIGAGVTLRSLASDPAVAVGLPAVAAAAAAVGNARIRAVATIGGAIAHADPRQDLPPALLAQHAEVEIAGRQGRRRLPLHELATGFMSTVLEPDELITEVRIPIVAGQRGCYQRFTPASNDDYPTVAVASTVVLDPDGTVTDAAVAVGGAASTAYLVPEASSLVGGRGSQADREAVGAAAAARSQPTGDRLGSPAYKREMVAIWTARNLARGMDRAVVP